MKDETSNEAKETKLTAKQELFVQEYLIDLNATQACIRAGYSEKTANREGSRLLSNVDIQKAIDEEKLKRNQRKRIDQDYVLQRLIDTDQLDIADILDSNGAILPIHQWSKIWRQNISNFEIFETDEAGYVKKIKLPDKLKNLELIGKHIQVGAWVSNSKVDITTNGESIQPTTIELVAPSLEDIK